MACEELACRISHDPSVHKQPHRYYLYPMNVLEQWEEVVVVVVVVCVCVESSPSSSEERMWLGDGLYIGS